MRDDKIRFSSHLTDHILSSSCLCSRGDWRQSPAEGRREEGNVRYTGDNQLQKHLCVNLALSNLLSTLQNMHQTM